MWKVEDLHRTAPHLFIYHVEDPDRTARTSLIFHVFIAAPHRTILETFSGAVRISGKF
jgi:hypothetical protein